MTSRQDNQSMSWEQVDHEIAEGVSAAQTGGKLGSASNCRGCPKNKQLNHHQHLIPASEFKQQDLDTKWSQLSLRGKLTLDHCLDFIKLLIPMCVRLECEYVSEGRPSERYPLSEKRGQELYLNKNVGSGWISYIYLMSDDQYVCEECGREWRAYSENGVYECPGKCDGWWRVKSQDDGKCPECGSDTREEEEGKLKCGREVDKGECFWAKCDWKWWKVVSDDVGGTCPQCQTEWWKAGEKDACRCPDCGERSRNECVCHGCLASGKRGKKWWRVGINAARHVVYDRKEWGSCNVVMFDDGESEPVKLTVGRAGVVVLVDTNDESCRLVVYTCDSGLVEKLEKMVSDRWEMCDRIGELLNDDTDNELCSGGGENEGRDKYSDDRSPECSGNKCNKSGDKNTGECSDSESECSDSESSGDENDELLPCVLIGYPHGRQCYVSLGESHTRDDSGELQWTIQYEISSCPGFSGGLVWRPGDIEMEFATNGLPAHHHRGSIKSNPRIGLCTRDVNMM